MPVPEVINAVLESEFEVEMTQAPTKHPAQFCFGCFCPCCAAYQQRKELLQITGEPYYCCGGGVPLLCLKEPQNENLLFCEVCCCTWLAISGNRYIVQTRFGKRNTQCDEFIITFTVCCSWVLAIMRCCFDVPRELEMAQDTLVLTVMGCMHAQQQVEIDKVKQNGYELPGQNIVCLLPPQQQEMIKAAKPMGGVPLNAPCVMGVPVQGAPAQSRM